MAFKAKNSSVVGDVSLGSGSSIWFNAVVRADESSIKIGKNTNVQDCAVLHTPRGIPLEIGDNVTIGHGAVVHCRRIGDNCIIGMNATLLEGAEVGNNCIIAAGSVVVPNARIPDNSVAMGAPAKVVRASATEDKALISENAEEYAALAILHSEGFYG